MIPREIIDMADEATSAYNSGFTQIAYRDQLRAELAKQKQMLMPDQEIVEYIEYILGDKVDGE